MSLNTIPIIVILSIDKYTCSQNEQTGRKEPFFLTGFQVPFSLYLVPYVTSSSAIKASMKMKLIQLGDRTWSFRVMGLPEPWCKHR